MWGGGIGERAGSGLFLLGEGYAADGGFEVGFNLFFEFGGTVPVGVGEAWVFLLEELVEVVFGIDFCDIGVTEEEGFIEEGVLDILEELGEGGEELGEGGGEFFFMVIAAGDGEGVLCDVFGADFEDEGGAFFDPLPHFIATTEVTGVDFDFDGVVGVGDILDILF